VRVVVLVDYYLPGFRGGAIFSLANLVERLSGRFEFWIITRDRDVRQSTPHRDVALNTWTRVGAAMVFYTSPGEVTFSTLRRLIGEVHADVIYLNSVFSGLAIRTLLLRRAGLIAPRAVLLGPEGELSPGAFQGKRPKKVAFLRLARATGLYRGVVWRATTELEREEILQAIGSRHDIVVAPVLTARGIVPERGQLMEVAKQRGAVRFLYLSRITPKKNLRFFLELLTQVGGTVSLDIVGVIDDQRYWHACERDLALLPPNVTVHYHDQSSHAQLSEHFARTHFSVLPTLGENFAFALFESLAAGRPVLTSTMTPWRGLAARRAGWDLSLDDRETWLRTIQHCVDIDDQAYQAMVDGAWQSAHDYAADPSPEQANARALERAVQAT
jgi:glycosyltransferase involved in cell wall biosynthesis